MKTRTLVLVYLIACSWTVAGCAGSGAPQAAPEPAATPSVTETSALMLRHFDRARVLSSAAIFGRVDAAHDAAAAIRDEEAPSPARARGEYDAFLSAVAGVEAADDRASLARAVADLTGGCGDCHLASGLGPSFNIGRIDDPRTPRDHLRVLAWGSSRMWESLVAQSDLAWRAGARALSGQPLREELYVDRMADPDEGRRLGARLHELGVAALSANSHQDRVRLLGDVWATCSGCHELIGLAQ